MTSVLPDQVAGEDDEPTLEELGLVAPPEDAPEPFNDLLVCVVWNFSSQLLGWVRDRQVAQALK